VNEGQVLTLCFVRSNGSNFSGGGLNPVPTRGPLSPFDGGMDIILKDPHIEHALKRKIA
jgi:hypothetical protein